MIKSGDLDHINIMQSNLKNLSDCVNKDLLEQQSVSHAFLLELEEIHKYSNQYFESLQLRFDRAIGNHIFFNFKEKPIKGVINVQKKTDILEYSAMDLNGKPVRDKIFANELPLKGLTDPLQIDELMPYFPKNFGNYLKKMRYPSS